MGAELVPINRAELRRHGIAPALAAMLRVSRQAAHQRLHHMLSAGHGAARRPCATRWTGDANNQRRRNRRSLGARDGARTRTPPLGKWRVLSPLRLPISPPGQAGEIKRGAIITTAPARSTKLLFVLPVDERVVPVAGKVARIAEIIGDSGHPRCFAITLPAFCCHPASAHLSSHELVRFPF